MHVAEVEEARAPGAAARAASPTITLWSLASPWITCAPQPRQRAGTTSASKRSSARSASARRAGSATCASAPAIHAGAREVPREVAPGGRVRRSRASAPSISPSRRPSAASVSGARGRASASVVPGSQLSIHTSRGVPSGPGTSVDGVAGARGRRRAAAAGAGARASRCASAAHCTRHERRARAPGASPSARTSRPSGRGQAEVVVELARQRPRPGVEPVERGGEAGRVPLAKPAARRGPRAARAGS